MNVIISITNLGEHRSLTPKTYLFMNVGKKVSGKKVSGKKVSEKKNPEKKYQEKK